jgi:hypothetical protein
MKPINNRVHEPINNRVHEPINNRVHEPLVWRSTVCLPQQVHEGFDALNASRRAVSSANAFCGASATEALFESLRGLVEQTHEAADNVCGKEVVR